MEVDDYTAKIEEDEIRKICREEIAIMLNTCFPNFERRKYQNYIQNKQ